MLKSGLPMLEIICSKLADEPSPIPPAIVLPHSRRIAVRKRRTVVASLSGNVARVSRQRRARAAQLSPTRREAAKL
jgi:hypothetical protein